jgi:hypothetical protein
MNPFKPDTFRYLRLYRRNRVSGQFSRSFYQYMPHGAVLLPCST